MTARPPFVPQVLDASIDAPGRLMFNDGQHGSCHTVDHVLRIQVLVLVVLVGQQNHIFSSRNVLI